MIQFTFTLAALEYYLCDAISCASGSHQREPLSTKGRGVGEGLRLPCQLQITQRTHTHITLTVTVTVALAVAVTAAIQNVAIINSV